MPGALTHETLMSNKVPLVSVIVTCFNREHHVAKTIESVIAADAHQRVEIIVVDDSSGDSSVEVIRQALRPSDRLVVHEVNRGQNAAINTAMEYVRSEFVAFCDSDDLYGPLFLERSLQALDDRSLDFVYSRVVGGPDWDLAGCDRFPAVLEQGYLANLGALLVRTAAFRSIGRLGEREVPLDMCQDDRICFELARRYCFGVVAEPLYHLKGSANSVTKQQAAVVEGWDRLFEDYRVDIHRLCRPGTLARHRVANLERAAQLPGWGPYLRLLRSALVEAVCSKKPQVELLVIVPASIRILGVHVKSWASSRARRLRLGLRSID